MGTPSSVRNLAYYLMFQATNELVTEMHTLHGAIQHAPNIGLSKTNGSAIDVLFIKVDYCEVCAGSVS